MMKSTLARRLTVTTTISIALAAPMTAANAAGPTSLSAYPPEPPSPDAGKEVKTCGYYTKMLTQEHLGFGRYGEPDIGQGVGQQAKSSCKFPTPPKGGQWAKLQKVAQDWLKDDLKPGDVVLIPANSRWGTYEDSSGGAGRSVHIYWYSKTRHLGLNQCGEADENFVCEPSGSKSAKAINMAHYRLDEAKKAQTEKNDGVCQAAARQAVAISRGLPKFRKRAVESDNWAEGRTYKTRYDAVLDEKALFKKLAAVGKEAEKAFKACGGKELATTEDEEFVFSKK